tara:strand:- start:118 stop:666 length:549 start_codon:yes stop_codon:yes gene_type:complete
MSILKIAKLGHPVLLEQATAVKNIHQPFVKQIIDDMAQTMLDAKGIGLAAPQVHLSKQIIVFRTFEENESIENDETTTVKVTALINPKIKNITEETNNEWEGCLSIPGMLGLVKRFNKIKYEGLDVKGNVIKKQAEGLQARIIQHEYDHLMGILYISRLADSKAFGYAEEIEEYWKKKYEEK